MKKEIKAIIAVVLAIWFFVMGFEIGIYKERKAEKQTTTNTPVINLTPSETTAPPVNYDPQPSENSTAPSESSPSNGNSESTQPSGNSTEKPSQNGSTDPSKMSKDEITKAVSTAMNNFKNEKNFSAHKKMTVKVNVIDCSVPSAVKTINGIIEKVTSGSNYEIDMTFKDGVYTDEKGNAHNAPDEIPPAGGFKLTSDGVAKAEAKKSGSNTIYTITVVPENTTMESPVAKNHSISAGYLDIASLDIPVAKITKADMHYPGAVMTITVNAQGKLIELDNHLPMTGEGEASIFGATGRASFEGALDEHWNVTYQ